MYQGKLLLNDFDMSCLANDTSNIRFKGSTCRFASPFLDDGNHIYNEYDDRLSLVLTILDLIKLEVMELAGDDPQKKKTVLRDISCGKIFITAMLQDYVKQCLIEP